MLFRKLKTSQSNRDYLKCYCLFLNPLIYLMIVKIILESFIVIQCDFWVSKFIFDDEKFWPRVAA